MARFFINRPIFAIVLSLIITLLGITAVVNLPIAQYPQISPPTISVSTTYAGANADVVDQTVAQVIEEQVNGVEDMVSMSSTSNDAGSYSLSIQFETEKNADTAAVQAQNRVAQANASLPSTVQTTGVTTRKASQDMSLMFNLWSPDDSFDANFLKNYGTIYLIDDIKRVSGVGEVSAFGSDYSMRIWLQPEKMAQLAVSVDEVTSAIEAQNIQAASGSVGKMPADTNQQFQYSTRVKGRLSDPKEYENIVVRTKEDGGFIRLKDIARVELASSDYNFDSILNGHVSAGFGVKLNSDANALETITQVRAVLEKASKNFPVGMEYKIVVDNTNFVRESMREVLKTFAEALLFVIIVVFIFLQSWRATLIPVLAIPVSLLGTFAVFKLLGFTINTLTLFAMVLAIGLVVDDAIVVIEAVEHHMRYSGLSPREATKRAMSEVSGPVVAIAFVLASVFLPVAFFSGTTGILYKQFALTIVVSMTLSAIVALSLTPALCVMLLKPFDPKQHAVFLTNFFAAFNGWFEHNIARYGGGLTKLIAKGRLCMFFLLVIILLTGSLYKLVPSSFIPDEDQGFYMTAITLPEAASLNRTVDVMKEFSKTVSAQPGISTVMAMAGMDMLGGGGAKSNAGAMFISLNPWDERQESETQVKGEIGQTMQEGAKLTGGTVISFAPSGLPGLGMVGGMTLMLEDRSGGSLDDLDSMANKFVEAAKQRPQISSITSTFKANTPSYEYEVNRDKAEQLGVAVDDVFTALQVFLGGKEVNDFNKFGRSYKVKVQADTAFRSDINATRYLFVKSSNDTMVPLNTLLMPKKIMAPTAITRYNGVKAVQINATQASGYSSGQAMAAIEEVAAQTLTSGYTYEWSGQSREEKVSSGRAPIIFGMAFLFMFLCLAALYESWSVPLAVLLSVPLGVFGAFLFQYVRNLENSIYMQIGLVMLIGLAAKNAILIVEFAKVRVDKGMNPVQAAVEAAKTRVRPILMTSLAFIIGCIPLAVASGAGAGARNSMGTAVVGGMFTATLLGIFLIPVLFVAVEKLTDIIHNLQTKLTRRKNIDLSK
ncbi:MAG: bepE 2 [Firmicutes bacterium]|nr:bepE 2 [Bacillota bacterium]